MDRNRRTAEGASERGISAQRKGLFYAGMAMMVVGPLFFLTAMALHVFGGMPQDRASAENHARTMMLLVFGGGLLLAGGQWIRRIGARGLAGSGLVLDPNRARREMEPWTRMAGGMAEDALSEVESVQKIVSRSEASPIVQVRCRACKALNSETAKFCDQCGSSLA